MFIAMVLNKYFASRQFKHAFGFVVSKKECRLFFSLPFWTLVVGNKYNDIRFLKSSPRKNSKSDCEKMYGPTDTYSADDIMAKEELLAVTNMFNVPTPKTLNDNESLNFKDKSIIMIGSPVANFHSRRFLKTSDDGDVRAQEIPFSFVINENETDVLPKSYVISNNSNRKYGEVRSLNCDYAIVLRIPNPECDEGYIYFVAAPAAEGTLGAAEYLKENWKKFVISNSLSFFNSKQYSKPVGVIIKVDKNNHGFREVMESTNPDIFGK